MSGLALWSGFLGAWLLVAGPVYQAAVELRAEGLDRDELAVGLDGVVHRKRHSRLWWLLPPVGFVLDRRWRRAVRRVLVEHHGWPLVVHLGVVVVMAAACALNTKASTGRGRRILAENAVLQR